MTAETGIPSSAFTRTSPCPPLRGRRSVRLQADLVWHELYPTVRNHMTGPVAGSPRSVLAAKNMITIVGVCAAERGCPSQRHPRRVIPHRRHL